MTNNEASNPSVAITGAGSGLGRELALKLADKGYRVFGTALHPAEVDDLATASGGRVVLSVADITDETAVTKWVDKVANQLGARGLDVLISNAGILTPGPLEVLPLALIKREYEVNVFGALAVINAFLPSLRTSGGRIVAIGAMTGRFPLPFNGPSRSTKAALEAIADVYRAELKPFGVHFVVAQAGNMVTGGPAKTAAALQRTLDSMTPEQRALYGDDLAPPSTHHAPGDSRLETSHAQSGDASTTAPSTPAWPPPWTPWRSATSKTPGGPLTGATTSAMGGLSGAPPCRTDWPCTPTSSPKTTGSPRSASGTAR